MKKKKKQNIILAIISIAIIALVIGYFYSMDQTRLKGFTFGNEIEVIQNELKTLQIEFDSKTTILEEGDMTMEEFLDFSDQHIEKMRQLIPKYDELNPPESFASSVRLFKLSTETQIESDVHLIQWIETGDESEKIRSDALLQESFEYELAALAEFNTAKLGRAPP